MTVCEERGVKLLDVEGTQRLEPNAAEAIGDSPKPISIVAKCGRSNLGRDGDEPPFDPIADCLRIGCHVAAVGDRTDELRHRVLGSPLGAEPALSLLSTPAGRG